MFTGSRFWTIALVLGLCLLATAGCKRKRSGNTFITGSDIFTTDEFPGESVQSGNVADDQRAMSVSGEDVSGGSVRVFANGDRGISIVTYRTTGGRLYAHYYNDGWWSPPVALSAVDCVLTTAALPEGCHRMIQLAKQRGGEDNITVVVAEVDGPEKALAIVDVLDDRRAIDLALAC